MDNLELNRSNIALIGSAKKPSMDIEGSIFVYPDFITGRVKGSSILHKIRYNAFDDELEIIKDGSYYKLKKTYSFPIEFVDTNETIIYSTYYLNRVRYDGYLFEVANNDHFAIYRKTKIVFIPEKVGRTSFEMSTPPEYKKVPDVYFIQKEKGEINAIPELKKEFINLFPEKKELINQNFKGRKIDFSNISEINKLLLVLIK
ncbi:MAG: hypothetical protein L6264_04600 [Weeksellaceae bacterium]|nr:hypothetical protein [Weeksellaceae bacterium]